jgi:hypothetical protein
MRDLNERNLRAIADTQAGERDRLQLAFARIELNEKKLAQLTAAVVVLRDQLAALQGRRGPGPTAH